MEAVQQAPQDLGLANERRDTARLTVVIDGMGQDERQGLIGIMSRA
jgi:hypothetical protein